MTPYSSVPRTRWAWQVARRGTGEVHTAFWWGNIKERDCLEDLDVVGGVTLQRTIKKQEGWV